MKDIKEAYEKVFDSDGSIKVCGREACSNLINACSSLEPTVYFGNSKTGIMDTERIQKYYITVNSK